MRLFVPLILVICFVACGGSDVYTPKPRVYPKINYPDRDYISFNQEDCPFTMPVPDYFRFQKDESFFKDNEKADCWFDLYSPDLNSYIYFSYVKVEDRKHFDQLVKDAFELADKHNVKASYRDEITFSTKQENVSGIIFEISGPVATPVQFFLTDSTQHFLRGSLYFKAKVNRDSILPVYQFVKTDLDSMLSGFTWQVSN